MNAKQGKCKGCKGGCSAGGDVLDMKMKGAKPILETISKINLLADDAEAGGTVAGSSIANGDCGRLLLVYFGGKWCKPCVKFSPTLAKFVRQNEENLSLVFVSVDNSEADFNIFRKGKPYLSVPFKDIHSRRSMANALNVTMFPGVTVIDTATKKVVTHWGRFAIEGERSDGYIVNEWLEGRHGLSVLSFIGPKGLACVSAVCLGALWLFGVF